MFFLGNLFMHPGDFCLRLRLGYNGRVKDQPRIEVTELQKRNPAAWTAMLQVEPLLSDVVVTAVSAEPLYSGSEPFDSHITRYVLSLDNCSDPISFIGKKCNRVELIFYRDLAELIPGLTPRCWFTHLTEERGWLVLDDVPNFHQPPIWSAEDVEMIINELTRLHAAAWQQNNRLQSSGLNHFIGPQKYSLADLQQDNELYFDEGPAAIISQHALDSAGALAPILLKAANGLTVIRSLDGWPGILGETHMTAVADLLDDPVPMLQPLKELPVTLLHGNPFSYHWRLTFLDQRRLIDWQQAMIGPGICDLVSFIEQFDMIYEKNDRWPIQLRPEWPVTEETMIDSYLLSLSGQLGERFDARAMRQAIPAARCLHVVTNWFPYFANWFSDMPNKYTWQKVNRMSDDQLMGTVFQPIIGFRPYLARIFQRFLQAFRKL